MLFKNNKNIFNQQHTLLHAEENFILVATCNDNSANRDEFFQTAEILSKTKTAPSSFIEKAEKILASYGIPKTFVEISHDDCQK